MRFFPFVLAVAAAIAASLYFFSAAPTPPPVAGSSADRQPQSTEGAKDAAAGLGDLQRSDGDLAEELRALKSELQDAIARVDRIPLDIGDRLDALTARVDALAEGRPSSATPQDALRDSDPQSVEPTPEEIERTRRALSEIKNREEQSWAVEWVDRQFRTRPKIAERVRNRLRLGPAKAREFEAILTRSEERQDQLLVRLQTTDPEPTEEERYQIYGEIKDVVEVRYDEIEALLGEEGLEEVQAIEKEVAVEDAAERTREGAQPNPKG